MCVHACLCERGNAKARCRTCIGTRRAFAKKKTNKEIVDKNCQRHFIISHILLSSCSSFDRFMRRQKPPFGFIGRNLMIKSGTVCSKCDGTRLQHFLAGCVAR